MHTLSLVNIKGLYASKLARVLSVLFLVSLLVFSSATPVQAAPFDKNNLITDSLFVDTDSLSVSQIQDFLESKGSLLANWVDNVDMRRPSDNCIVHHATGMTAAEIIHEAANTWGAQVYDGGGCAISGAYWSDPAYSNYTLKTISPKALLVTLQKEQSLVTANGAYSTDPNDYKNPSCCSSNEYKLARATGYGVPDSGSINEKYLGFYNQINWAAWQLRYNYERSAGNTDWDEVGYLTYAGPMTEGTFRRCAACSLETFDGFYTIDGSPLYMENRATASLYYYTPHTYPGYFGNYNFVQFFTDWFGSVTEHIDPYQWEMVSLDIYIDSGRTNLFPGIATLEPGQTAYITLTVKNDGFLEWDQSNTRLGTINPQNRIGTFLDGSWLSTGRPAKPEEVTIEPGDNATFEFSMTAPADERSYSERLVPMIENVAWMSGHISVPINVVSPNTPAATNYRLNAGEDLLPQENLLSTDKHKIFRFTSNGEVKMLNNFTEVWSNGTGGQTATRLSMQGDGNLVLYNGGSSIWSTGTNGNPGAYLELRTDGNAVVTDGATDFWTTNTDFYPDGLSYVNQFVINAKLHPGQQIQTANREYRLIMQTDGNLVIYSQSGPIWATGTNGISAKYFTVQGDGNMVLYNSAGDAVWSTRSNGNGPSRLLMQDDGNLVLYKIGGGPIWSSGSKQ